MKFRVVKLGRPSAKEYSTLVQVYEKRLKPLIKCESEIIKLGHGVSAGHGVLARLLDQGSRSPGRHVFVGLDERGKQFDSVSFAAKISRWTDDPRIDGVTFVIGDPYGLSEDFRSRSDLLWSLSLASLFVADSRHLPMVRPD